MARLSPDSTDSGYCTATDSPSDSLAGLALASSARLRWLFCCTPRRAHVTRNGTIASTRQFEPPPNEPIVGAGFGGLYAHGRAAADRFSGDADRPPQPPPRPTRGLSAARARGHKGGWKPLDPNAPRAQMTKTMYQDKSMQVRDICQTLRISRSTLYRWMASQQQQAATPIQA